MHAHAIRGCKEFVETDTACLVFPFHFDGQTRALEVNDLHAERECTHRKLAANLTESNNSKLPVVQGDHAGNARPVAVGSVLAIIRCRLVSGRLQLLYTDQISV